ncbi:erythroblast NAD(P)(+)--arginine ADP-ribosyltransferase-like [Phalacrocorax aristotelis]|uniref:erythroblast NAD(P)(+)--arginine ADP-ribosyltransferase-like n=1 Tax=Phalacrocorax aristotelis TaxID=126867 RepID=UPI003F4B8BD7
MEVRHQPGLLEARAWPQCAGEELPGVDVDTDTNNAVDGDTDKAERSSPTESGTSSHLDPLKELALDMAPNSFDDQYRGCSHMMEEEVLEINCTNFANNSVYAEAWTQAATERRSRQSCIPRMLVLWPEQAVAWCRGPCWVYAWMQPWDRASCRVSLRRKRSIGFAARHNQTICFGHFTSASLRNESTLPFGRDTFFSVETCYGVPIRDFSFFPEEEEVLIPPFEHFEVTDVAHDGDRALIHLRSQDVLSTYNCELVKGGTRFKSWPCAFNAGWSIPGDHPHLWGLLLAATALAAAGAP